MFDGEIVALRKSLFQKIFILYLLLMGLSNTYDAIARIPFSYENPHGPIRLFLHHTHMHSCLRIYVVIFPQIVSNRAVRRRPKPAAELDALFLLNSAGADNVGE